MTDVNYEYLEKIVLIVWDEKSNYDKEVDKIGVKLFQASHQVYSVEEFDQVIDKYTGEQAFLFLVHIFHNENKQGFYSFRSSKLKRKYPGITEYLITSAPKRNLYEKDETLIVFSYDDFPGGVGSVFKPQTKIEISERSGENSKPSRLKKGIFLSHSSKDSDIVEKFKDLVLINGLGVSHKDIMFTSREEGGIHGGINIPNKLHDFLKNKMALFIQFLSLNYRASETCVNEEGAAWIIMEEVMLVPVLLPGSDAKEIAWILNTNKGIRINSKPALLNLYQGRKEFFSDANVTIFDQKVDEFITYINSK
ncbi:toll/interleukin-1 receptor domain-containing protein [uncultured Imperialibacter sp.]|uniref:toll/interleukin-1 receptor domain-containing protein n=1 Tax=uncultured Imperialibacter sp. TaxID=1672639 RepID=UPI0030DAA49D